MSNGSRERRDGRNAFYRGGDPNDWVGKSSNWHCGWAEAKRDDDAQIAAEQEADLADFDKVQEFARLYNLAKEQGLIT